MAGHLRQRGANSWQLLVYVGKDRGGRRRYASKTFRGTRRQAEYALAAFVGEVTTASLVPTGPILVEAVVRRWLEAKAPRLSPATVARYEVALRHIVPAIGRIPVGRLRTSDVEDFYGMLHAKGLSGSSIRKVHWAMRGSLAWAKRRGYVTTLATEGVELPPLGEKPLSPPSPVAVRQLVERTLADDPEFGTLLAVVAWTGCRRGEACGLRWHDIDLEESTVLIQRSIAAIPGGIQEKTTKTGTARRIAIGPATTKLLHDHLGRCRARASACGAVLAPSAFVFSPDPTGQAPWHPSTISHRLVAAYQAAGITKLRMHDLRHYSATTLLKHGASVGEVMDRHGWTTLEMVGRYRHLLEAVDREAAATLERA